MPGRKTGSGAWLLIGLLLAGAVQAETSVRPGINDHYRDARWGQWVGVFESPGREIYDRRLDILSALELREGMVVADVGAERLRRGGAQYRIAKEFESFVVVLAGTAMRQGPLQQRQVIKTVSQYFCQ